MCRPYSSNAFKRSDLHTRFTTYHAAIAVPDRDTSIRETVDGCGYRCSLDRERILPIRSRSMRRIGTGGTVRLWLTSLEIARLGSENVSRTIKCAEIRPTVIDFHPSNVHCRWHQRAITRRLCHGVTRDTMLHVSSVERALNMKIAANLSIMEVGCIPCGIVDCNYIRSKIIPGRFLLINGYETFWLGKRSHQAFSPRIATGGDYQHRLRNEGGYLRSRKIDDLVVCGHEGRF